MIQPIRLSVLPRVDGRMLRRRAPGSLRVLVDAGDDAAVTHALLAAQDPRRGYVVVHPTPAQRGVMTLAADVLVALGHSPVLQPYERPERLRGPAAAVAWAHAQQVDHLVVLRAHLLPPACWQLVLDIARLTGADPVMVCHVDPGRLRPPIAAFLARTVHRVLTDVSDVLPPRTATRAAPAPPGPAAGRHPVRAARRTRAERAEVAAVGRAAARARGEQTACAWLADHPLLASTPPEPGSPWALKWDINWPVWLDHEGIRQLVTGLVLHSPDRQTTAAVLDGVAAGFAHHGLHLHTPRDLSLCAGPGLTTLPVTADVVDQIQARVTSPQHAAALALTLITEVWPSVLAGLTIGGVSHDAATVTLPPHTPAQIQRYGLSVGASQSIDPSYRVEPVTFGVPAPARPLLAAARYLALLHGGDPAGLLLHDPRRPMDRILAPMVGVLADHCGVALPPRLHPMDIPWTARVGSRWRSGRSSGTCSHVSCDGRRPVADVRAGRGSHRVAPP